MIKKKRESSVEEAKTTNSDGWPGGFRVPSFYAVADYLPSNQKVSISKIRKQVETLAFLVDALLVRKVRPLGSREEKDLDITIPLLRRIGALTEVFYDMRLGDDARPYGWSFCATDGCQFPAWGYGGSRLCRDCASRCPKCRARMDRERDLRRGVRIP
jgi:hypothetical protein